MRAYVPGEVPREFDPRLVKILRNMDGYLHQVDSAFGLIGRGLIPVAGAGPGIPGTTIGGVTRHSNLLGLDADDHLQYAHLPGRIGGQTLFGTSAATTALPTWVDTEETFIQDFERLGAASTTWSAQPVDVAAPVGRIILLSLATHETTTGVGTPTGSSSNHSTITDTQSNTWVKLREYTANEGAGGPGTEVVTISLWYCKVTTELTTADSLTFTAALSLPCWAVESRQFTSSVSNPLITIAGNATDRFDTDSDPGSQTISGLTSGEYLFVRGIAIHGTPGGADINLYNVSSGFVEFVTPHNNSTIQSEAADRQIGARGEFKIASGTGATSDPAVDAATFPDSGSVFIALQIKVTASGDLLLQSVSGVGAAAVFLEDQTVRISGAGDLTGRMVRFDAPSGTNLSYIRASDGAFVGPAAIAEPSGFLLLAGASGGQHLGAGTKPTGGNTGDFSMFGRFYLGDSVAGTASTPVGVYVANRGFSFKKDVDNSSLSTPVLGYSNIFFNIAPTGTVASGVHTLHVIEFTGGAGTTSGVYSINIVQATGTLTVPAGTTLSGFSGLKFDPVMSGGGAFGAVTGIDVFTTGSLTAGSTLTTLIGIKAALSSGASICSSLIGFQAIAASGVSISAAVTQATAYDVAGSFANDADVVTWSGLRISSGITAAIPNKWSLDLTNTSTNMGSRIAHKIALGWNPTTVAAITARTMLAAGTTDAGTAPLKFQGGTLMTTPEAGVIEYTGSTFYFTTTDGSRVFQLGNTAVAFGVPGTGFSFVIGQGTTGTDNGQTILRSGSGAGATVILDWARGDNTSLMRIKVDSGGRTWEIPSGIFITDAIGGTARALILTTNSTCRIRLGDSSTPVHSLEIVGGSTTRAPIKLTSAVPITTPVAGCLEFQTDDFFATITTGAARKAFILDDGTRLTGGKIPIATTNGRLVDLAASAAYTPTNVVTDRSYDANATSIDELADVLGTVIADLQAKGILG